MILWASVIRWSTSGVTQNQISHIFSVNERFCRIVLAVRTIMPLREIDSARDRDSPRYPIFVPTTNSNGDILSSRCIQILFCSSVHFPIFNIPLYFSVFFSDFVFTTLSHPVMQAYRRAPMPCWDGSKGRRHHTPQPCQVIHISLKTHIFVF